MPNDRPAARPLRLRLAEAVRAASLPQFVVERDHALSYLLTGIYRTPGLRDIVVFKGGTCLRKAYFRGYRFSEDLDFTVLSALACVELEVLLNEALVAMRAALEQYGPFRVTLDPEVHREPHPAGQCSFRVRVQYPWMREPHCSLKVELTLQEPLLAGFAARPLIHEFSGEDVDVLLQCYRLEEIIAEKLRGFLQGRQRIDERGWSRNRPRDLYDLWRLRSQDEYPVDWAEVGRLLPAKAAARGVYFSQAADFLDERLLAGMRRDWQPQLANFVPGLPPYEECLPALPAILTEVLGR